MATSSGRCAREQRLLGDARRAVGRAHGRDCHAGEHERPACGGEGGDRHPVGHGASLRSCEEAGTDAAHMRCHDGRHGRPDPGSLATPALRGCCGRGRLAPPRDPAPRRRRERGAGRDAVARPGSCEARRREAARGRRRGSRPARGSLSAPVGIEDRRRDRSRRRADRQGATRLGQPRRAGRRRRADRRPGTRRGRQSSARALPRPAPRRRPRSTSTRRRSSSSRACRESAR